MSHDFNRPLIQAMPADLGVDAARSSPSDLMAGLVAAAAIMAHADGEMAGAERRKILAFVRETPALKDVARDDVVDEIATHEANYRLDPEVAHLLAREKLNRITGDRQWARLALNACRAVLPADGIAHPSEYRTLTEIRTLLGLDVGRPSGTVPVAG